MPNHLKRKEEKEEAQLIHSFECHRINNTHLMFHFLKFQCHLNAGNSVLYFHSVLYLYITHLTCIDIKKCWVGKRLDGSHSQKDMKIINDDSLNQDFPIANVPFPYIHIQNSLS